MYLRFVSVFGYCIIIATYRLLLVNAFRRYIVNVLSKRFTADPLVKSV